MKKSINKKRGISLIVLVVTIIVMIILATAIILSLRSSGIIDRANEAKEKSDEATKREVAAVKLAEYELGVQVGDIDASKTSANDYVKAELEKDGIDTSDMVITAGGEIQVGLSEVAVAIVESGAKIGDTVTGYTLSTATEAKTLSTDGSENTCDPDNYTETDPIPATGIARDESITWKYFGIDENGEALIVGSVTSTTPKIILGGKGGYLNGPSTLKTICEKMYSSDMGTARSITIDDVTRVLEYTGEKGAYYSTSVTYTPMAELKTINEIATEVGYDMSDFASSTPESGKEIGDYVADYYYINKTADAGEYNTEMQNLIYPESTTTNSTLAATYWLASPCIRAHFGVDYANFTVRCVDSTSVGSYNMFDSNGYSYYSCYAVRPVVKLASTVQVAYDGTTITLS